eukprot:gene10007-11731_t
MSDEFERPGRSFKDGHDPTWTGIDKPDDDQTASGKKSLQFYNASQITTRDGNLVITTTDEDTKWRGWNPYKKKYETMSRHFKSGMLQSWNKFCFTGGILEVDVQFPGESDIGGLWPAVWLLGNLGRATFQSSTNLMWPWSYTPCDRELQHAQEISGCDITTHYSLHPKQGRGATEIDMIEVMPGPSGKLPIVKNGLQRPYNSMTLQLAPGIPAQLRRPPAGTLPEWGFTWYNNLTYGENTSINPFFYGHYLGPTKKEEPVGRTAEESYQCDAISSMMQLEDKHFKKMHTFRLEWQPGPNGYVHWYGDGKFRFGIEQSGLDPYGTEIPTEPSYVILNTAISTSWGFPNLPPGCAGEYDCKTDSGKCGFNPGFCKSLPAEFLIGHVRVYQNKNDPNMTVGCNPRSHPTKRYIAAHPEKFALPGAAKPLKDVKAGGGKCETAKDCNGGSGASKGTQGCCEGKKCHCAGDFTGPNCLVPTYQNDFPDWDVEPWAVFVPLSLPLSLVIAVALCAVAMLVAVFYGVYKRNRNRNNSSGGGDRGSYVEIGQSQNSGSNSWL